MKRTSAYLSHADPSSPRHASDTPVAVESLRFRERDGKTSAYTRLYAQGVDQLVHKDHVYRQYGLHKSPPAPSTATQPARLSKTLDHTHMSRSASAAPLTSSVSSARSSSTILNASGSVTSLRVRGSSALVARIASPRHNSSGPSSRQRPPSTAKPAKSTVPATKKSAATPPPEPQRRQSTIATQLLNKTLKINPAIIHSATTGSLSSTNASARSPRMSITARGVSSSLPQPPPSSRRMSYQISSVPRSSGPPPASPSASNSPSKQCGDSNAQQPPVLVPVSRRTSSPLVAANAADFGMRRRPSVSPIRGTSSLLSPSSTAPSTSSTLDEATRLLQRRDSHVDRLVEQITVLKNSLGLSDEDLQWKVESTKGNAYEAADRHLTAAEEAYDRLIYEIQLLSETPCDEASAALAKHLRQLATQSQRVDELKPHQTGTQADLVRLKKQLKDATIASELREATGETSPSSEEDPDVIRSQQQVDATTQSLLSLQQQLEIEITRLNEQLESLSKATDTLAAACARFSFASTDAAAISDQFLAILRCVPECSGDNLVALCEQGITTAATFSDSKARELKRKEFLLAKAMRDIEIWKQRKEQSKEFAAETAKHERVWLEQEKEANAASLARLRSLIPVDIQQLSIEQLIDRARQLGVLYTYDLASYLKQNRMLHWLVTHEADIARDNFLTNEWFGNLSSYDIDELRAMSAVLPMQFEFDKGGKKAVWRRQFLDDVELLAKQQCGACIKAGWDPVKQARADVPLKPLSEKQRLNVLYRYPTDDEIKARVGRFELQQQRLAQKRAKLDMLESEEIPTAKAEYLAVAEDARNEELQQLFGKATLIKLRDDAKAALQALTKTRDALALEIASAEKAWSQQTPSYEQFVAEAAQIQALPQDVRAERIKGPFPAEVEPQPRARAAFKKLSVEEEARARRMELSQAIADRDKATIVEETESGVAEGGSAEGGVAAAEQEVVSTGETGGAPVADIESLVESEREHSVKTETSAKETAAKPIADSFRRVKSLRVSVEVLRFLQNDFCSRRRTRSQNHLVVGDTQDTAGAPVCEGGAATEDSVVAPSRRRSSVPKAPAVEVDTKPVPPKAPSEPPKPKSKALAALLQRQQQQTERVGGVENDGDAPPRQKLDFLSELRNKATKKNSNEGGRGEDMGESSSSSARPAVGFLGELKRRVAPVEDAAIEPPKPQTNANPIGFLDELRRRANKQEATEPSSESRTRASPPRNFLDELKARASRAQEE